MMLMTNNMEETTKVSLTWGDENSPFFSKK